LKQHRTTLALFGISISYLSPPQQLQNLKTESHMAYGCQAIRHVIIDNLYKGAG
jgi:hypothetical protein